jgi:hypothetical protein
VKDCLFTVAEEIQNKVWEVMNSNNVSVYTEQPAETVNNHTTQ